MNDLKNIPWNIIEDVDDIDDSVFLLEKLFKEVADQHAPIKSKRAKGNRSPWVTEKLSDIRCDRDYHLKKAHIIKTKYHWNMYRKLCNHANAEERKLKSDYIVLPTL